MSIVVGILIGIFMLMALVTGHEFGHFLMARKNGVEVEEFGICFPPRVICWRKVKGEWTRIKRSDWEKMPGEGLVLSLNLLPIGGFCQMKGENASDVRKGTFGAANFRQKTRILFGGVAANWLIAFLIFTVLAFCGMPQLLENQFRLKSDSILVQETPVTLSNIIDGSPAEKSSIQSGDIVKRAECGDDVEEIVISEDLLNFNSQHAGEKVRYTLDRGGEEVLVKVKLNDVESEYLLGASVSSLYTYRSTWSAPIVGAVTTLQITYETFKGVGSLLVDLFCGVVQIVSLNQNTHESGAEALVRVGDSMSGPVGIIGVLFPIFASTGVRNTLFLVALISISLACMNVLPIPALDGGRWLLIAFYKLRKKKLTKEVEEKIVGRAFAIIIALALIVTILDVVKIVK